MPRTARAKSSSGIYHLMLRGINRQDLFEEDEDRRKFVETLGRYKPLSKYEIYAYCLMSNHVHLLLKENEDPIATIIKRISGSYVLWYNKKYSRCGHLFQERFKSEVVETDSYFLTVLRYIHQNPLKAGITNQVESFRWSSCSEYLGNSKIIDVEFALDMFSKDREEAKRLFLQFMQEVNSDQCLDNRERIKVSDKELLDYLEQLGIDNSSKLQRTDKNERDKVISDLKNIPGVSIRQLARITGIPKHIIEKR
ncbi:MAG: transposase [Syntrophomonas sp.]|nr:transposase [Syntrophomonas sp.]